MLSFDHSIQQREVNGSHGRAGRSECSERPPSSQLVIVREIAAALRASTHLAVGARLKALVAVASADIPVPGSGRTLDRWRVLAAVGAADLSLARVYAGHLDALAIAADADAAPASGAAGCRGVWAMDTPHDRIQITSAAGHAVRISGTKRWCPGARDLSQVLISAWRGNNGPYLIEVILDQPCIYVRAAREAAIGTSALGNFDVTFDEASGSILADRGFYLSRPGFWHAAIGDSACWFGGATAVAEIARAYFPTGPLRSVHLGKIDVALWEGRNALCDAASWIDDAPNADARCLALRTRAVVEQAATTVLQNAARGFGASEYAANAAYTRMASDLPVFLRQHDAELDLAHIGVIAKSRQAGSWAL